MTQVGSNKVTPTCYQNHHAAFPTLFLNSGLDTISWHTYAVNARPSILSHASHVSLRLLLTECSVLNPGPDPGPCSLDLLCSGSTGAQHRS